MTEQLMEETAEDLELASGPIPVSWATVPRVNLLPVAIVQGRRFKRTQRMLGLIVLTGVVAAGAGVFVAQRDVSTANDELSAAQSQVSVLTTQAAKYAAVPTVLAKVQAAQKARTSVMGTDVLWYRFLSDLDGALPAGVTQDSVTLTLSQASGSTTTPAATGAGPLTVSGLGILTVTGEAPEYPAISAWLDSLDAVTGVASPSLTSATKSDSSSGGTTIKYSVTAVITEAALSHRYDKEGS
jgi:Tfp pilus assembly protein PilN